MRRRLTDPIIATISGHLVEVLNPDEDSIHIHDIAHALSMTCRWVGHVREFYSVADHSLRVSELALEDAAAAGLGPADCVHAALHGLMHDAAETYTGDLASPVKDRALILGADGEPVAFRVAEERIQEQIRAALGLRKPTPIAAQLVHEADRRLLVTEDRDLRGGPTFDWDGFPEPLEWRIRPIDQASAKLRFLARWEALSRLAVSNLP
jgi:5'-deoxynucleotidase YfbR-like HD superfamily hydrolase